MKRFQIALVSLFCLFTCASAQTVELFNGKNLDGWTPFIEDSSRKTSDIFFVKDGSFCVKGNPFGFIRTNKKYSNFKLHVEWRYPTETVNSGIFVFMQDDLKIWPNAIECQLMKGRVGDFVLLGGSDIAEFKVPEGKARPKFPVVKRLNRSNENPTGEWNNADIICKDGNIVVYINGELQNRGSASPNKSGFIALQSEGSEIHFRNIRLTPIAE